MLRATWVTQTGQALPAGAKLHAAYLTAKASGDAKATLYPAPAPVEKPLAVFAALAGVTFALTLPGGVPLPAGLYVELDANSEGMLLVWE